MTIRSALIALLLVSLCASAEDAVEPKTVSCEGLTVTEFRGLNAGEPKAFSAVFKWVGTTVDVQGHQEPGFAKQYDLEELTEGRKAVFRNEDRHGTLTFYLDDGRFEILVLEILPKGLLIRTTNGTCKKYEPSDAFK